MKLGITFCIKLGFLIIAFIPNLKAQEFITKSLWQPYYITPRYIENTHFDLSGNWEISHMDYPIDSASELDQRKDVFITHIPNSIQWSYYEAGKLPHPYEHMNSEQYSWIDEKVWYYQREFNIPEYSLGNNIMLCFDGLDYFSRIWVNGILLGEHEGMFGGPDINISKVVNYGKSNHILVELKAGNWGNKSVSKLNEYGSYVFKKKENTKGYIPRSSGRIIKPWLISGGVGGEMFFSVGMWQGARIEILPKNHMERPFLRTISADEKKASLHLSLEVLAGVNSLDKELHPWKHTLVHHPYEGNPYFELESDLKVEFSLIQNNEITYQREFSPQFFKGVNWLEEDIVLPNPQLWFPNGMGAANLYQVKLVLKQEGRPIDQLTFDYGIRTIERIATAGPRTSDRWEDWQFIINGKKLFVKGTNWMPVDILLGLKKDRYRWALESAKNMGIQMIRVWGGGIIETDEFYELCNELGIMVWQDFPIGNQDTPDYPQDIWESQVVRNIFRLRNHPSLVVWCGGNEFNPYSVGNTASIGIIERNLEIFDNTRLFVRTTPDEGTMHSYPDIDPCWFNKSYKYEPWVSETGIHSIPEPNLFYELVDNKELEDMGSMWDRDFNKSRPEFVHHFVEFIPSRVPKMLSRASHIDDLKGATIESISEASQIGAGEFYQIMSEKIQGNYPITTGLLTWVYKRPWPTVGIQLMDWFGQPVAPYYFLKRTYEPIHVSLDLERMFWAPGESIRIQTKTTNVGDTLIGYAVSVKIFDDRFQALWSQTMNLTEGNEPVKEIGFESFKIPNDYKDKYLFITAELRDMEGGLVSRSIYYPRVLKQMEEDSFYERYSNGPMPLIDTLGNYFLANHRLKGYLGLNRWPALDDGPFLKPTVARSKTSLKVSLISNTAISENNSQIKVSIENTGNTPAFMTKIDLSGIKRNFYATDNYFWLSPGEKKEITLIAMWREPKIGKQIILSVNAWNGKKTSIKLK